MIPHMQNANVKHIILETTYNKHHSRGRSQIENVFGMLKKMFKELLLKSNLHILFMLDVVNYYCILYNLILDGQNVDVNFLMLQLDQEVHQVTTRHPQNTTTNANARLNERDPTLEGNEFSKSSQPQFSNIYKEHMNT